MDSIDLRSDTVTWPTPAMREAMANAEVGDDVWGDDPTVIKLEALAAERMGHEAGLFVTSGTQGNLIAILTHCRPGDEMIVGKKAHTFKYEVGGPAALGGVHPYTIPVQPDGTLALDDIEHAIRDTEDVHYPLTRLVELENTQGTVGGIPLTAEYTRQVRALCDAHDLVLHVDGARIWNAAAALGVDVSELASPAHSATFCLSKGLCAPAGSVLVGSKDFIRRARRVRKMLGGGMRQTGILAAAGILAIEEMAPRLHEDHVNACALAGGLAQVEGIGLNMDQVQTNMVFFWLEDDVPCDAATLAAQVEAAADVKLDITGPRSFRAVTHYWITPERVQTAVEAIGAAVRACREGEAA